jgi:hypothetical protein
MLNVKVKVKVKLSLCLTKHHAMKTYWVSGGIASRILNLGTRWRLVVNFKPRPLYPQGKSHWIGWVGGPQSRSGHDDGGKNFQPLPGIEPSLCLINLWMTRSANTECMHENGVVTVCSHLYYLTLPMWFLHVGVIRTKLHLPFDGSIHPATHWSMYENYADRRSFSQV